MDSRCGWKCSPISSWNSTESGRVSIATVSADGPFSLFAGYDRHIMVIEGHGMVLAGGPHGPIDVSQKFSPQSFSGDWPIFSRLVSGPVRDFNLMARRDSVASDLACVEVASPLLLGGEPDTTIFAHLLDGALLFNGDVLADGDSLLLQPGEQAHLTPQRPGPLPRLVISRARPCTNQ